MFGFAWVRTHLGVILSDVLGVLKSFGLISEKKKKLSKIWSRSGVLCPDEGTPRRSKAVLRRGTAELEEWPCDTPNPGGSCHETHI